MLRAKTVEHLDRISSTKRCFWLSIKREQKINRSIDRFLSETNKCCLLFLRFFIINDEIMAHVVSVFVENLMLNSRWIVLKLATNATIEYQWWWFLVSSRTSLTNLNITCWKFFMKTWKESFKWSNRICSQLKVSFLEVR